MRALNIGAVVHAYPPAFASGSEVVLHQLLRRLSGRGHRVTVTLTRQPGDAYRWDGLDVVPSGPLDGGLPRCVEDSDILVTHLENAATAGALANQRGIPVVQLLHLDCRLTKDWLAAAPALTVCCSNEVLRSYREVAGATGPVLVVRPLIDPRQYRTRPGDLVTIVNLCRDRVDESVPGGLPMGKGGQLFWKIADQLPGTRFLAVRGMYGDQDLRDLPNVEVLPPVAPARMRDEVYARTRVLLVPSAYEAWGRVGTEAIVSGIPVVASPVAGLLESLGQAGIFAATSDVNAWIRAITSLSDPGIWQAASDRSLARAAELGRATDLETWCHHVERLAS